MINHEIDKKFIKLIRDKIMDQEKEGIFLKDQEWKILRQISQSNSNHDHSDALMALNNKLQSRELYFPPDKRANRSLLRKVLTLVRLIQSKESTGDYARFDFAHKIAKSAIQKEDKDKLEIIHDVATNYFKKPLVDVVIQKNVFTKSSIERYLKSLTAESAESFGRGRLRPCTSPDGDPQGERFGYVGHVSYCGTLYVYCGNCNHISSAWVGSGSERCDEPWYKCICGNSSSINNIENRTLIELGPLRETKNGYMIPSIVGV